MKGRAWDLVIKTSVRTQRTHFRVPGFYPQLWLLTQCRSCEAEGEVVGFPPATSDLGLSLWLLASATQLFWAFGK